MDSPAGSQQEITATSSVTSAIPSTSATSSSAASAIHRPASSSSTATGASDAHHHYHTIDGDDADVLSSAAAGEDVLADSDFDTEPDPKDWRLSLPQEELAKLSKKETQRQDVINGGLEEKFIFVSFLRSS